jgi:hypothetical protein
MWVSGSSQTIRRSLGLDANLCRSVDLGCLGLAITVTGCTKIWAMWPPTPHNLSIFEELQLQSALGDPICLFVAGHRRFHHARYTLTRDGECILIPPGTIHAVYTLRGGAVAGVQFADRQSLEWTMKSWDLDWEVSLAKTRASSTAEESMDAALMRQKRRKTEKPPALNDTQERAASTKEVLKQKKKSKTANMPEAVSRPIQLPNVGDAADCFLQSVLRTIAFESTNNLKDASTRKRKRGQKAQEALCSRLYRLHGVGKEARNLLERILGKSACPACGELPRNHRAPSVLFRAGSYRRSEYTESCRAIK